jgi:hypothetical protein
MASPEALERLFKSMISLVPQWYVADCGPNEDHFESDGVKVSFYSQRPLTPALRNLRTWCGLALNYACANNPLLETPSFTESLQEYLVLRWLKDQCDKVNWLKAINYLKHVTARTYENNAVTLNLIVSQGSGTADITDRRFQKVLDQLASSPFTYLRVTQNLELIRYEEIRWEQITDPISYNFYPAFLHPAHCALAPTEFSLHVTSRGDIVIMSQSGLVASRRKGQWKIYDVATFKNTIVDCLGNYYVGANLFELLLDLSFRRHGALLVYDRDLMVKEQVINKGCVLGTTCEGIFDGLRESVCNMDIGKAVGSLKQRRLLAEIASIDGAVLFDESRILAFGAMIKPHDDALGKAGTRSTAALSALLYGGRPIKVSSDGEVTIHFWSEHDGKKCRAEIEYL